MITKSPQYVRETAAGKSISAWALIRTGRHAGDVAAKISAHYSNARVLVNVEDVAGFRSATGDDLEHALSFLEVDGVQLYHHCQVPKNAALWLGKVAKIYRDNPLPALPDLGLDPNAMSWAEYCAKVRALATPEYNAAVKARAEAKTRRAEKMTALEDQVAARGMQFANGGENGPQDLYYISGITRLACFNNKLIQII